MGGDSRKVWNIKGMKAMTCGEGWVISSVDRRQQGLVEVHAVSGEHYVLPDTLLDWVGNDTLLVERVVDGSGDLYLRFRKRSQT